VHEPNLPLLEVDRQRLEQVFSNLIINATQAMHTGGQNPDERKLSLQTNIAPAPKGIALQTGKEPKEVVITIADTGPGIPVDARQQIFEPFFTTKARGTGLGLTVARRIIEEHKGAIKIESNEGKGTRFIITLPI
jgi:signal transduction histidine kinase